MNKEDWDANTQRVKRSHLNHVRLTNSIIKKLSEANDSALELETNKSHISVKAVSNKTKPASRSTFFIQADAYLLKLQNAGNYNQYTPDNARIKNFKEYQTQDIVFQDITPTMCWNASKITFGQNSKTVKELL